MFDNYLVVWDKDNSYRPKLYKYDHKGNSKGFAVNYWKNIYTGSVVTLPHEHEYREVTTIDEYFDIVKEYEDKIKGEKLLFNYKQGKLVVRYKGREVENIKKLVEVFCDTSVFDYWCNLERNDFRLKKGNKRSRNLYREFEFFRGLIIPSSNEEKVKQYYSSILDHMVKVEDDFRNKVNKDTFKWSFWLNLRK